MRGTKRGGDFDAGCLCVPALFLYVGHGDRDVSRAALAEIIGLSAASLCSLRKHHVGDQGRFVKRHLFAPG
jgi:hypothetical protein